MNDNNALVTKEFLRDTLRETFSEFGDRFAVLINKSFQGMEVRMARMESQMAKQEDLLALTARVGKIEQRLDGHDREFKDIHKNFDIVFAELKDIRRQLNRVDTRAEVLDLQVRVTKLERKVEL
jgi:uncharacterized coiled-coil protein SlyX